ncbi:hypothetical protein ACTQ9L_14635 [Deinococcus wulumuqiensis]
MPRPVLLLLAASLLGGCAAHPGSTSREAARVLEQAGLAQHPRPFTFTEYGSAPRVGDGVQFTVPGVGAAGHVIHVTNVHERRALNDHYARSPGSRSAMLGPLVLHVSGDPSGEVYRWARDTLRDWQAGQKE